MSEQGEPAEEEELSEIAKLLESNPNASASFAHAELNAGRLEWLAEHIIRCDYRIDPMVARTLLELIDGSHPEHALRMVRSKRLGPKAKTRLQRDVEDFELAQAVARKGGFERAELARVCHEVGQAASPKLKGETVRKRVRPWRDFALRTLGFD